MQPELRQELISWVKLFFGFFGIIILLICFYFISLFTCSKDMNPETHLIPNHYIGEVTIAFNSKHGDKRERKNGARIYRIHENGNLKTKFSKNYGWISHPEDLQFFYSDGVKDTLYELIRIDWPEHVNLNRVNANSIVIQNYHIATTNDIDICSYRIDTLKNFPYYNHYLDSLRTR